MRNGGAAALNKEAAGNFNSKQLTVYCLLLTKSRESVQNE